MSKAPAFQLYAADFYMDTISWSAEVVGVYFRLLMHQWVNGSIPDDIEKIARIAGTMTDRNWRSNTAGIWRELCHKFVTLPDGNLVNVRLENTRQEQARYIELQREKGKKRAEKMWEGHIATAIKRLQPEAQPKDSSSSSSSSSIKNKDIIHPVFPKGQPPHNLASFLFEQILENSPKTTKIHNLNNGKKEETIQRWAIDIDKLIRIDKQKGGYIAEVIEWATEDKFWSSNIESAGKLRAKWDTLVKQMERRAG